MRDFILTLLCAVLIADAAFAQPQPPDTLWTRTYGGIDSDRGCCAQQTTDGGYIIAGMTESYGAGGYDVYLIKTNALGDTIWTQTFGGSDDDYGNSVQQTIDGGYIIAGSTNSFSSYGSRVYLIKTNDYGDTLWTKTFGEDGFNSARSIQQTSDGGYIVAGSTNSYGLLYCDVYLIKTDAFGDTLWTKTFGGDYIDYGNSVQQTSDGGYIITGEALANVSGEQDVYLIKTDTYGDTLWTNTFGSDYEEEGISVQQTSDGGYIIAGYTFNSFVWLWDVYLIRTDADGNEIWHQIFVEDDHNWGSCVKQTNDGGYIITSVTEAFGDDYGDVKVIKTDADGDTLWTKTIEEGGYGLSIQQTNDSGYIIGGHKFNSGYSDVILIRLDSEGTIVEGFPTPHPSSC
ncbi:MAG: hypothetical protein H8E46_10905, partial [FCB group bacterium]|nr:hypothetical protein [FCB group bacterium]